MENVKEKTLSDIFGKEKYESWLSLYSILENKSVHAWIIGKIGKFASRGKPEANFNVAGLVKPLQDYCNYYNATPDELLSENLDERNARLQDYLTKMLNGAISKQDKKGAFTNEPYAESSVKNKIQGSIKSFFSYNANAITYAIPTVDSGTTEGTIDEIIFSKEMLDLVFNGLRSIEYRLILKCQAGLGLRINDVLDELTAEKNGKAKYRFRKHNNHYYIRNFETGKQKVVINFLFFPNELTRLFESAYGNIEKIDLRDCFMNRIKKENGSLKPNRIAQNDFLKMLKKTASECGITDNGNINVKTHSVRKFFNTCVQQITVKDANGNINTSLDIALKKNLTGHKFEMENAVYNQLLKSIDWYYENWLKMENCISISTEIRDETNEKVQTLENELSEMRSLISDMKAEMALMREYAYHKDKQKELKDITK